MTRGIPQLSFAGGELTPSLHARVDITRYVTGLATCRNNIVLPQGGLISRPGTELISEVKDSARTVRLQEYVFSNDQAYVIEWGHEYVRVFRNGVKVPITGIILWTSSQAFVSGHIAYHEDTDTYYLCILSHTNQEPPNGTYWTALDGVDDLPASTFHIVTPYQEAELPDLQFAVSSDVIVIVHPSHIPQKLIRGAGPWSFPASFPPFFTSIDAPTIIEPLTLGSLNAFWVVTTVVDGEESANRSIASSSTLPASGAPIRVRWNAVTGADTYRVYRFLRGAYGFIGETEDEFFDDFDYEPDYEDAPPEPLGLFASEDNYPSVAAFAQQSLFLGATNNAPRKIWRSKIGFPFNFDIKTPIVDDSSMNFELVGSKMSTIRHLAEKDRLFALTDGSEVAIRGKEAGIITPTEINPRQQTFNGASGLRPLTADALLYVQARGSKIRALEYSADTDGYNSPDLTIFSAHLFKGHTIEDWAYQINPYSVVWVVRDDGVLLGLTFVRDQEMLAWHRHDTDGIVENVCVVPEGNEDALYLVVKRTIDGATKRYIERMHTRTIDDIRDLVLMDCSLTVDGRHTGATTMTLSGSGWTHTATLTLTASAATFSASDIGNDFHLTGSDGTLIRFRVTGFTSSLIVTGRANKLVPVAMRAVAISTWARAIATITGLDHLEGKEVAVLGDGFVVASPNNPDYTVLTVTDGEITLPRPYAVVHVGLPYIPDVETLNIQGSNPKKLVTGVQLHVEETRGLFVGGSEPDDEDDPTDGLVEAIPRSQANLDEPPELETGLLDPINIRPEWKSNGRVWIRQVDPVPMSILSITPIGQFSGGS